MSNISHKTLVTTELHVPGYLQSGDPGAVGAGKYWLDTTLGTGLWVLKVRNAGDTGWEVVSRMSNIPDSALATITTPGKVSGAALTLLTSAPVGAGRLPAANVPYTKLAANTTVNFTSGMSIATMQALIDAEPKDLASYTLTAQFADGTYTMTDDLLFTGFYGGKISILGNILEDANVNHTTQAVILSATTSSSLFILNVISCQCDVVINNIKTISPSVTDTYEGITCNRVSGGVSIYGCYCLGSSASYGYGIHVQECPNALVGYNYVSTMAYGIIASLNSGVCSISNASYVPNPSYGLFASGSVIRKNGDQPTGAISDTGYNNGGSIEG